MTNPHKVLTTWTKLKHNIHTKLAQETEKLTNLKKSFTDLQQENKLFLTQQTELKKEKTQLEVRHQTLLALFNQQNKEHKEKSTKLEQEYQEREEQLKEWKQTQQEKINKVNQENKKLKAEITKLKRQ